jgi:hypothetical protein
MPRRWLFHFGGGGQRAADGTGRPETRAAGLEKGNTRREKRLRMITGYAEMLGFLPAAASAAVREPTLFIFPSS